MVDCANFLEEYSDYRDGRLSGLRCEALSRHLAACDSCARYDRVVRQGVAVFAELPAIEPSADFMPRLQHRIYHLDEERSGHARASGAPVAFTVAIAATIALSAWMPVMRPRPATVELPPVAAHAPHRVEAVGMLFQPGPFLSPPRSTLLVQPVGSGAPLFPSTPRVPAHAYRLQPVSSR